MHSFAVTITDANHPVTKGMKDFQHVPDELYHRQLLHPDRKRFWPRPFPFPTRMAAAPMNRWSWSPNTAVGRVFHCAMGHHAPAMAGAGFQVLDAARHRMGRHRQGDHPCSPRPASSLSTAEGRTAQPIKIAISHNYRNRLNGVLVFVYVFMLDRILHSP